MRSRVRVCACAGAPCRQRCDALAAELAAVSRELAALQAASADIDALEERYW